MWLTWLLCSGPEFEPRRDYFESSLTQLLFKCSLHISDPVLVSEFLCGIQSQLKTLILARSLVKNITLNMDED